MEHDGPINERVYLPENAAAATAARYFVALIEKQAVKQEAKRARET